MSEQLTTAGPASSAGSRVVAADISVTGTPVIVVARLSVTSVGRGIGSVVGHRVGERCLITGGDKSLVRAERQHSID